MTYCEYNPLLTGRSGKAEYLNTTRGSSLLNIMVIHTKGQIQADGPPQV